MTQIYKRVTLAALRDRNAAAVDHAVRIRADIDKIAFARIEVPNLIVA